MIRPAADTSDLPRMVQAFFRDDLQRIRSVSGHTMLAYKNTLRLFFVFVAEALGTGVTELTLDHLTVDRVVDFLEHIEGVRENTVATRNHRLTCLRGLFRYLARNDPTRLEQYQRVISLPAKRAQRRLIDFLEPEHVKLLIAQPEPFTRLGLRDHTLLLFLYNTGARVGEALSVSVDDLHLDRPHQVHLRGKGKKDRVCPMWTSTSAACGNLVQAWNLRAEDRVFRNARGRPLSRDGVAHIVKKHFEAAAATTPTLRGKRVTPHVLRHSCAVGMLQSGVDITVIRDYLGHESIATTGVYAKTNITTKREALEAFWERAGLTTSRTKPWNPTSDLLNFLSTL